MLFAVMQNNQITSKVKYKMLHQYYRRLLEIKQNKRSDTQVIIYLSLSIYSDNSVRASRCDVTNRCNGGCRQSQKKSVETHVVRWTSVWRLGNDSEAAYDISPLILPITNQLLLTTVPHLWVSTNREAQNKKMITINHTKLADNYYNVEWCNKATQNSH